MEHIDKDLRGLSFLRLFKSENLRFLGNNED